MQSCCKAATWLTFGHRYQPRFDYGLPTVTKAWGGAVSTVPEIIESSKPRTYVHDICVRCGDVIQRPSPINKGVE